MAPRGRAVASFDGANTHSLPTRLAVRSDDVSKSLVIAQVRVRQRAGKKPQTFKSQRMKDASGIPCVVYAVKSTEDKRGSISTMLVARIAAAVTDLEARDPLSALETGAQASLDASENDRAIQQITLVDAPSVLGWERWREVGMRFALGMVKATLEAAIESGQI
jgi:CO/xanthine dehydrogenase FAD-binding subunit